MEEAQSDKNNGIIEFLSSEVSTPRREEEEKEGKKKRKKRRGKKDEQEEEEEVGKGMRWIGKGVN